MKSTIPKWRGIKTTQESINEVKAVTITNRLKQKSMSLPRIDDKKRWAGFPGLSGVAAQIAKLIPKSKFYVEPFAGAVKVYQELNKSKIEYAILNDKSKFVTDWLHKEFPESNITKMDFAACIKRFDTPQTVFIIDPPWVMSFYNQGFAHFNRDSVKHYDEEILKLCKNILGKFIITSKSKPIMLNSPYHHKTITSIYPVSGNYPQVLLTSNLTKKQLKI